MNKKNKLYLIIILCLVISLSWFGKETIEEKNIQIQKLEKSLYVKETEIKELSMLLEEKSENKHIEITKETKPDGSKIERKKIITSKSSKKEQINESSNSSKEMNEKESSEIITDKSKIITNPKRLRLGIGSNNHLSPQGHLSYEFLSPFGLYINISKDLQYSAGIFIEF